MRKTATRSAWIVGICAWSLGFVAAAGSAEPLSKGPMPAPFHSLVMSGKNAGTEQCLACLFLDRPGIVALLRDEPAKVAEVLRGFDRKLPVGDGGVQAAVVFVRGVAQSEQTQTKNLAARLPSEKLVLAQFGEFGPKGWRVTNKTKALLALVHKAKVIDSWATEDSSELAAIANQAAAALQNLQFEGREVECRRTTPPLLPPPNRRTPARKVTAGEKPAAKVTPAKAAQTKPGEPTLRAKRSPVKLVADGKINTKAAKPGRLVAAAAADREYWIQLENRDWNVAPPKFTGDIARDRLTGFEFTDPSKQPSRGRLSIAATRIRRKPAAFLGWRPTTAK